MEGRLPRAVVAVAVGLLLTGCQVGGSGDGLSATELLSASVESMKEADSARVAIEMTGPGLQGGKDLHVSGSGETSFGSHRAHFTYDFSDVAGTSDATIEIIVDGLMVYMESPAFQSFLPAGKEWISLNLEKAAALNGTPLESLKTLATSDPTSSMKYLEAVIADDTKKVGDERVRGVDTTHLHVVVDLDKASELAEPEQRPALDQLRQAFGSSRLPLDVWIDEDNRLRAEELNVPAQETGGISSLRFELYDYGVEVDTPSPPHSQTVDALKDLLGR
jgi:hypothetical protein